MRHDLSIGIASPGVSPQTSKIHPNLPDAPLGRVSERITRSCSNRR
jgi:hypothetical protein